MQGQVLRGRLASGIGLGRYFTSLEWARSQFVSKLGIDPYPGTLNLRLDDTQALASWTALKELEGIWIDNPEQGPQNCDARCFPVLVEGRFPGAIVLPDVKDYAPDLIEIIAAKGLRAALGVHDGDLVKVELSDKVPGS